MKKGMIRLSVLGLTAFMGVVRAAIVTVTTVDDGVSNIGNPGTFYWAITNASAGDTIKFAIPGAGPHYLKAPPGGFPLVYKKSNLTIDGYSQNGGVGPSGVAAPNSNPITAANNAVIKIVVDGRNGHNRDMAYETYDGTLATSDPPINNTSMALDRSGYGHDERALLGIYRSTNVNVKGIAFLGAISSLDGPSGSVIKGICLAHDYDLDATVHDRLTYFSGSDAYGHVNGCWFGVDPGNPTVAGVAQSGIAVTAYRHRGRSSGDSRPELPNVGLTVGVAPGSANPRAEFNVLVAHAYEIDCEGIRWRLSGNFIGVMPDGVTPYNATELHPFFAGGQFEYGRYDDTNAVVIGTDGDGVNDADEGNLFGPLAPVGGNAQMQMDDFTTGRKPWIIAGNRFGIAVDGTIWTNNASFIGEFRMDQGTQFRFGSDFNGVSDALEANVVYDNNDFATLFPSPSTEVAPSFLKVMNNVAATDGWTSIRGNKLVNSFSVYNPDDPSASKYTNNWNLYFPDVDNKKPVLAASTITSLKGTFNAPTNSATNIVIDVYLPDPQSQTNGAQFDYPFFGGLTGPGFVEGRTYLGSFLDNGPYDSNPAVGAFSLNIGGLSLAHGTKVTVAVVYSKWARPVITSITHSGTSTTLTWSGDNGGPYNVAGAGGPSSGFGVQSASSLTGPWTTTFAANNSITLPAAGSTGFYRIIAPISGMTTLCADPIVLP
jgi:hypothetical protein